VAGNGVVYVCETLRNRVLRFVRTDTGAWIPSVWRQFSGLLGPVGVTCKELKNGSHCVVVARSGVQGADKSSVVSVLDAMGNTVKDISLPSATCSGITLGTTGDAFVTAAHQIYQVQF
jgi:sugar lactone lactonase YvrE